MKSYRSTIVGFAVLVVLLTAGAAQSLSGSNTVYTDDIVNGHVTNADLGTNSVTGGKVYNNTLTNADINESTLVLTCVSGTERVGDTCYGPLRSDGAEGETPNLWLNAALACEHDGMRLPSFGEGLAIQTHLSASGDYIWTDEHDGVDSVLIVTFRGYQPSPTTLDQDYRCVTTVGARP